MLFIIFSQASGSTWRYKLSQPTQKLINNTKRWRWVTEENAVTPPDVLESFVWVPPTNVHIGFADRRISVKWPTLRSPHVPG